MTVNPAATERVSVIIANFNYAQFVVRAAQSALDQSHIPHEVIVVDDGSTDNSREMLAGLASELRVVRQVNQGVSVARNTGAAVATGDYLAFLDADDYWHPDKLRLQLRRRLAHGAPALLQAGFQPVDRHGEPIGSAIFSTEMSLADLMIRF